MARYKLTPLAKSVLSAIILLLIAYGTYYLYENQSLISKFLPIEIQKEEQKEIQKEEKLPQEEVKSEFNKTQYEYPNAIAENKVKSVPIINLSLDEWIGWKPIIDANGGLETAPDSIYAGLGVKVSIKIINDATLSSTALIKGDLTAAGYTLNRLAFLMDKFDRSKTKIVVPYLCNNSSGGDGIISKNNIKSIEQLYGKKIVLPRYSEAQTLVWWLLRNSSLTKDQINKIQNDMILVDTPDAAAKVFFAGKADAAATWQPYLSQAQDPNSNAHLLFSTKNANNLILDVITFRKDFYEDNLEYISKFIEGALKAHSMYKTEVKNIKNVMPQMADISNQDLIDMSSDGTLSDYATNMDVLGESNLALNVFNDMADIWRTLNENVPNRNFSTIFDISALKLLNGKFITTKTSSVKFTEEQKQSVKPIEPIITKRVTIEFTVNSSQFKNSDDALFILRKIADQCNIVDGMILQIEGNTSSEGGYELNKRLSYDRARTVVNVLKSFGVDPSRFIIEGNGPDNPVADNKTKEGKEANRRTDIFFKSI